MSGAIDTMGSKKVLLVASNPATSEQTGWPIGYWAAELTHPYWELTENGYEVDIASPEGGKLAVDSWSDPTDESGYSVDDLISQGFLTMPKTRALVDNSLKLSDVNPDDYDAILLVGGQGPMYTFYKNQKLEKFFADFYETGKIAAAICHATCILLHTRLSNGDLLVKGKTWTGFANSEEDYADNFVGKPIQPFRIEDEARKLDDTNFIVDGMFKAHVVRDGNLITGQQQHSGTAAARLIIEALGK
ncbi:MAG: type 1 glutamine amidotransferase domain-containing protein [Chloroflexota bacterium]